VRGATFSCMSFCVHPIFKKKTFSYEFETTGEHLGAALDRLDELAEKAGVPVLAEFDGSHAEVPEDFDGDPEDLELPPAEWTWFDPNAALPTVDALLDGVRRSKSKAKKNAALLEELEELRASLIAAAKARTKFQIAWSS
jgi:hypothetical protein